MKCLECGGPMKSTRENHQDVEGGLPYVVLMNLEVMVCQNCGEKEYMIPRIEDLHRLLARVVINKPGRLTGDEIRFLRTHLGYSSGDFARRMGVTIEQVSRWEHEKSAMSATAERLLRLLVAYTEPVAIRLKNWKWLTPSRRGAKWPSSCAATPGNWQAHERAKVSQSQLRI